MRLSRPPEPGIVATYVGGKITKEELRSYLHQYLPRCERHVRCPRHGEDHALCTSEEECETFTACDAEHRLAHSLSVYRQAAASLVVDRLIGDLVAKRKLSGKKRVRHLMKHLTEEINISDMHRDWHDGRIRVGELEIKEYYEENREEFGALSLSEVAEDIRILLTQEKENTFIESYLKDLRKNSGLSINYDLLKYPEPDEEQLRTVFFERRTEFRLPARAKLLLVEVDAVSSSDVQQWARQARTRLLGGASLSEIRESLADTAKGVTMTVSAWVSEEDDLWEKMGLSRRVRGEVTSVIDQGFKLLVARVEEREEPRPLRFEEVREQVAQQVTEELRERHLRENRNVTLFTIHGEPYSLGDFMEEFDELLPSEQAVYTSFEDRKRLVDAMVERALVVEDVSDDVRTARNRKKIDRVRMAVLKQVLHQEDVDDKITLADEELRKFFKKNKGRYRQLPRIKISYIRVSGGRSPDEDTQAMQKAAEALAELRRLSVEDLAHDGFARIAGRYSDDPDVSRTGGEVNEWIEETDDLATELFMHAFHEHVLNLKRGELSEGTKINYHS